MSRQQEETYHVPPYQMVSGTDTHVFRSRIDQLIKEGYVLYQAPSMIIDDKGLPHFCQAMILPHIRSADHYVALSDATALYACGKSQTED